MNKKQSIFDRIHVMSGWRDCPRYWWRYLLLPFGWDKASYNGMGWVSVSLFGFTFFWTW
jgi:hypothetical protein